MNLSYLIAQRFSSTFTKQGRFSGLLSMIGMGIGCFALVVSLSVLNGFESMIHSRLKGFDGDLRISGEVSQIRLDQITAFQGVKSIMPFMERRGLIEGKDGIKVVSLKAVDVDKIQTFYEWSLQGKSLAPDEVLIGRDLAYKMGKVVGNTIIVSSPIDQSYGFGIPRKMQINIGGIFSTRVLDYDNRYVFIPLEMGKTLFKRKNGFDGIDVRLKNSESALETKRQFQEVLSGSVNVQSWDELNQVLVDAMEMERIATIFILSLIFLVAAFNLAATLSLVSIQRMKETGILKTMGATPELIRKVMITMGVKKAGKGAFVGILSGILFTLLQNKFSILPLPSEIYFVDALPMLLMPMDVLIIFIISFTFIFIFSFMVGRNISIIDIRDALHWVK